MKLENSNNFQIYNRFHQYFKWYERFKDGRTSIKDDPRPGRPVSGRTEKMIGLVKALILANQGIAIREISEKLDISVGTVHSITHEDLHMKRVAGKFVPY